MVGTSFDDGVALGIDGVTRQGEGAEHGGAQDLRGLLDELVAGSIQEKILLVRPLQVPQSSSRTMTSWERRPDDA